MADSDPLVTALRTPQQLNNQHGKKTRAAMRRQ
jgi:hypothetical protein